MPTMLGDADDVLMFTSRSSGEPFVGKYTPNGATADDGRIARRRSDVLLRAEWPGDRSDSGTPVQLYTLYRRVLLVSPGLINNTNFPTPANQSFYEVNDLSVRMQKDSGGNYITVPNSLGDLTKRENRFAHYGPYPFPLNGERGTGIPVFTGITPPTRSRSSAPTWRRSTPPVRALPTTCC